MQDKRSLHVKVQEEIDCQLHVDPLREMSLVKREADEEEAAAKWIALAVLHGINQNAKSITMKRTADGEVTVTAKYRKSRLPTPGANVGARVMEAMRGIAHFEEGEEGSVPLALGVRNASVEIGMKMKTKDGDEVLRLNFPEE